MTLIGFVRSFVRTPRLPHLEAFGVFSEQKHHETTVTFHYDKIPLRNMENLGDS